MKLTLYIVGGSVRGERAEALLTDLVERLDRVDLEIVDVRADPEAAERAQVLATPTLSFDAGGSTRRLVGDMTDAKQILSLLGLESTR
ncbi:MAG: circadian clock KaiB family protein [Nitriliruptorales bacterium]|nr:circadian clock KaiB family protein [Nitriliruptorales bacterium]